MTNKADQQARQVGDLEDTVCRVEHSIALALRLVAEVTSGGPEVWKMPLRTEDRELLYFAVAEASDYARKLKAEYYAVAYPAEAKNATVAGSAI